MEGRKDMLSITPHCVLHGFTHMWSAPMDLIEAGLEWCFPEAGESSVEGGMETSDWWVLIYNQLEIKSSGASKMPQQIKVLAIYGTCAYIEHMLAHACTHTHSLTPLRLFLFSPLPHRLSITSYPSVTGCLPPLVSFCFHVICIPSLSFSSSSSPKEFLGCVWDGVHTCVHSPALGIKTKALRMINIPLPLSYNPAHSSVLHSLPQDSLCLCADFGWL